MFVAVEANSMAEAMSKEFVVRSVPGRGDDTTRGVVHGSRQFAFLRRIERSVLRFPYEFIGLPNFFRWLAENSCTRDVRWVAFDFTAAIEQHHVAFAQRL